MEANNRLVPIGTLADCQDNVAKWWTAVLLASAYTMLDQEQDLKLQKIIDCVPYKLPKPSTSSSSKKAYENKLGCVIKATMDSYRMVGYTSYCMNERIAACDHATTSLEELTESLTQRQEEECQLDIVSTLLGHKSNVEAVKSHDPHIVPTRYVWLQNTART